MSEPDIPAWVSDAVFYQIFPDRFARSTTLAKPWRLDAWGAPPTYHGYQGGDLIGILERLDYLSDLGIDALYLTPIFQSASNHRYHTHDYEKVDPMLGGDGALRRLLDTAHARGMRVVLDGVFNHASRGLFQFHDILENGSESAYLDWFNVRGFPVNAYDSTVAPNYDAWWNLPALPKFNTKSPAVREFLWNIGQRWVEFGIDGWRLDVAHEIDDDDFWREFRRRVRGANFQAYIVGEIWREAPRWVNGGDMWDAVMNYPLTRACLAFFMGDVLDEELIRRTSLHPVGPPGAEAFRARLERLEAIYAWPVRLGLFNLLGSHDMARPLSLARGDRSATRLATLFLMTYPGAPAIHYGDEIGMEGGHDPDNRRAFPWDRPETWDVEMLHDFQRMIALRRAHSALRRGSHEVVHAAGDVFAHARVDANETILVAFNVGRSTTRVTLEVGSCLGDGSILEEIWGKGTARVESGRIHEIELPPRSARLFARVPWR